MADAAAARREARKRKILENSQNRLQRIAGKCEGEFAKGSPIRTLLPEEIYEAPLISDSDVSFRGSNTLSTSSSLNNGVFMAETPLVEPSSFSQHFGLDATGDGLTGVATDLAALMSPAPETAPIQEVTLWNKLVLYKYDIVLVSLVVQLLYSFSLLTFDETYFFLPLVVYVVTKMIWFPAPSSSNFANALLLLNGISVDRVEKIMSVTRCVSIFSQDTCVYLFATICMQALYATMQDCLKA
ncbi:uncharacterized protein [Choristoneura fumiferana]|uniref:uncharacterized protein n=1 Tax=Choristoneura fumiferana TaxID=7141 RepID=UPI003D15BEE7